MAGGSSHTPKKACTHFLFCVPLLQVHFWFIQWQHQGMLVQVCRARPGSWAAITASVAKSVPPTTQNFGIGVWWGARLEGPGGQMMGHHPHMPQSSHKQLAGCPHME